MEWLLFVEKEVVSALGHQRKWRATEFMGTKVVSARLALVEDDQRFTLIHCVAAESQP
jgi:hypothetical protein